jgi:hypothetical protein
MIGLDEKEILKGFRAIGLAHMKEWKRRRGSVVFSWPNEFFLFFNKLKSRLRVIVCKARGKDLLHFETVRIKS